MIDKNTDLRHFFRRFRIPKNALIPVFMLILAAAALTDFLFLGLARRSFVFYDIDSGVVTVEDRMLPVSEGKPKLPLTRETEIARYVEEALLGPMSPNSRPLFPRETKLRFLMYRNGVVYIDLSEDAALPPQEGGEVLTNVKTLCSGIRRNFSFVRDTRVFIDGAAAFASELRQSGGLTGLEGYW